VKLKKATRKAPVLLELLISQGMGSRRECMNAILHGEVFIGYPGPDGLVWTLEEDPEALPVLETLHLRCGMWELPYYERLYIVLNKPANMECSRAPVSHASVLDFFSEPYRRRGLQPVGRLDVDATGLLLITDDGDFNHLITSPRRKLPKTYRIGLRHDLTPEQEKALEDGVILKDDPRPTSPAQIRRLSEHDIEITITEGRYHQVKRMLGAVGNRVDSIHRIAIGDFKLNDLAEGVWRHLVASEIESLQRK
jgi:16S rRNA pseudouridine516 synthase